MPVTDPIQQKLDELLYNPALEVLKGNYNKKLWVNATSVCEYMGYKNPNRRDT